MNICHANRPRISPSFTTPSRFLGVPSVLNQIMFEILLLESFSISKKFYQVYPQFFNIIPFWFYYIKMISTTIFLEYLYKKIHTQLTSTCSKSENRNTRAKYEICLKLRLKTPEGRHWRLLVSFLLTLNIFHNLLLRFFWLT